MSRTIVVGDIHGCYDELIEMLESVGFGQDDRVVCVGDLVTKGPKNREVLELFMTDRAIQDCDWQSRFSVKTEVEW